MKQKNKAITLIELLVVIGILIATSSMVVFFIRYQQPNISLYSNASALRSGMQLARKLAISKQIPHSVHFDTVNHAYQVAELGEMPKIISNRALSNGIEFTDVGPYAAEELTFNSSGAGNPAGSIVIKNAYNAEKIITVSPSGFIKVD